MLPAETRLRRSQDFAATLRAGRRAGGPALVLSVLPLDAAATGPARSGQAPISHAMAPRPAQVGFVVGGRIGGAVVRNRLRRRLQHLVAGRLDRLPPGSRVVIRALPGAERLKYPDLAAALDRLLARVSR